MGDEILYGRARLHRGHDATASKGFVGALQAVL
jgi:hypothetical protein